jgi:hypothetical protein
MELPVWLDDNDYFDKTDKFLEYYTQPKVMQALGLKDTKDIWLVDNASNEITSQYFVDTFGVSVQRYKKHYTRTAHLEYPYCWRGLYFCRDLFQEYDYDKIIHCNNDTYILSEKLANYVRDIPDTSWLYPYCPKHKFVECDIQVIGKKNKEFWQVTSVPYMQHNGQAMEHIIKGACERNWIGDRYGEFLTEIPKDADFSCQTRLHMVTEFK